MVKVLVKELAFGERITEQKTRKPHGPSHTVKENIHRAGQTFTNSFTAAVDETKADCKTLNDIPCYPLPAAVGESFERIFYFLREKDKLKINRGCRG